MKNYSILFFITILFSIKAGAQVKLSTENYNFFNKIAKPVSFYTVTEEMMNRLHKSVAVERQKILLLLEKMYPGIKEQMDQDLQKIGNSKDSALTVQLNLDFEKKYSYKLDEVWSLAKINLADLRRKYAGILGNIPFLIGQFGNITIRGNQPPEPEPLTYPDTFLEIGRQDQNRQTGGCGGLSEYILRRQSENYVRLTMSAGDAGGCDFSFMEGCKITVPDKVYRYFVANFRQWPGSVLGNRSVSAFGVSCAESTLSILIEADGVEIIKRDVVQVITVAPILWYAELTTSIPEYASISIYDPEKLPGKDYKVFRRIHCKVGSGGVLALAVAWNYVDMGNVRMTLIK